MIGLLVWHKMATPIYCILYIQDYGMQHAEVVDDAGYTKHNRHMAPTYTHIHTYILLVGKSWHYTHTLQADSHQRT